MPPLQIPNRPEISCGNRPNELRGSARGIREHSEVRHVFPQFFLLGNTWPFFGCRENFGPGEWSQPTALCFV